MRESHFLSQNLKRITLGSGAGRSVPRGRPGEAHELSRGHQDGSHADQDVLGPALLAGRRVQLRLHLQDIGRE